MGKTFRLRKAMSKANKAEASQNIVKKFKCADVLETLTGVVLQSHKDYETFSQTIGNVLSHVSGKPILISKENVKDYVKQYDGVLLYQLKERYEDAYKEIKAIADFKQDSYSRSVDVKRWIVKNQHILQSEITLTQWEHLQDIYS